MERAMLSQYIRTDALLGKFFETFLFEDVPANESSPQQVYLREVEMSDIYLGLYGNKYGYEDSEGVSPTERESMTVPLNYIRPESSSSIV